MSIKELKEREKEQRREYIIDAAEKLFFSKGYDNVSMNDIADAVEMNKATLYLYFENKDALYFAIVLRGVRIMNEMFRREIAQATTGVDRIRATGAAYLEFNRQHPDYNKLFHYAGSERFDATSSPDATEAARLSTEIFVMMGDALGMGMKDGTIRPGLNPLTVAIFLATASEAIISLNPAMVDALKCQGISHRQFIEDSMELIQYSIAAKPTSKRSD
jgi:TetR/AcrR family transcriptional regulator